MAAPNISRRLKSYGDNERLSAVWAAAGMRGERNGMVETWRVAWRRTSRGRGVLAVGVGRAGENA